MKIVLAVAAALTAFTAAPASAAAQERTVVHERTVVRHERHWNRPHVRRACNWRSHGHRRVRVCRTVRW